LAGLGEARRGGASQGEARQGLFEATKPLEIIELKGDRK